MTKLNGNKNRSTEHSSKEPREIQVIIAGAFTLIAFVTIVFVAIMLYSLFSNRAIDAKIESSEQFLNQTKRSVEDYLRNNRRISDTLYYSCIKNTDIATDSLEEEMSLMYESNKDNVVNIALYTEDGELVNSVPVINKKAPSEIVSEEWFQRASNEVENLHFSRPYVQEWSEDSEEEYHWVISLSRQVELNVNGIPKQGVLVIDMKYSGIQQMLEKVNADNASDYIYLCDEYGNIIYHPEMARMNAGLYEEANNKVATEPDGTYDNTVDGEELIIVTKTVSYTGWKLVSVISKRGYDLGLKKMQYLIVLILSITVLSILLINHQVSRSITSPLVRLDASIRDLENGNLSPDVYVGGPSEVEHLGQTLQSSLQRIRQLMDEVMAEQELKRRSELDALQSQINPHFLYNTLDSVIWMIEDEQNENAVYMVSELAKLLRVSISKGRTIIPIRDEITHARSYMNIQKIRYKTTCKFEVDDDILDCATIKLVIQPLLENAIYHGVKGMDEDGEITVRGYRQENEIYLEVIDNGYGMTKEKVDRLLSKDKYTGEQVSTSGNGVGIQNVNTRIQLRFGSEYGLRIESEPDEGTMMRIVIPCLKYTPDLEKTLDANSKSEE